MDKFVLFDWHADNEGGYGICSADKYNAIAIHLYEKVGFVIVDDKDYSDAWLMQYNGKV